MSETTKPLNCGASCDTPTECRVKERCWPTIAAPAPAPTPPDAVGALVRALLWSVGQGEFHVIAKSIDVKVDDVATPDDLRRVADALLSPAPLPPTEARPACTCESPDTAPPRYDWNCPTHGPKPPRPRVADAPPVSGSEREAMRRQWYERLKHLHVTYPGGGIPMVNFNDVLDTLATLGGTNG